MGQVEFPLFRRKVDFLELLRVRGLGPLLLKPSCDDQPVYGVS